MRFTVTAESQDKFNAWLNAQRTTPAPPATDSEKRGKEVFMSTTCIMCHNIGGTDARASIGPDLTHIASRPTIGAGTLPNNRGNLAAWVVDPQHIKPGIIMPPNPIQPDDFQALIDYLETLK
jgi:cytochrome c oxidase subunit 2